MGELIDFIKKKNIKEFEISNMLFDLIMNYPLKNFYPKMYNELFEAKELSWA